ncbi:hypothetical protein SVIOM342S_00472 [Streptomyces violaceorubidus]
MDRLREHVHATGGGGFRAHGVDWAALAPPRAKGEDWTRDHADLAASTQAVLEELLLELVHWLHGEAEGAALTMAGGVALNCVANSKIAARGPYRHVWVQPAAGDAGAALGGALHVAAAQEGAAPEPIPGADLGRGWGDDEIRAWLETAAIPARARTTSPRPSPRNWPATASSPGSRAAASSGRAPSDTAP